MRGREERREVEREMRMNASSLCIEGHFLPSKAAQTSENEHWESEGEHFLVKRQLPDLICMLYPTSLLM